MYKAKTCNFKTHWYNIAYSNLPYILPMNPVGKFLSVLTLASTLINLCMVIFLTSSYVKAYFRRFLKNTMRGSDSLSLWGPVLGRGAYKSCKKIIVNWLNYNWLIWSWFVETNHISLILKSSVFSLLKLQTTTFYFFYTCIWVYMQNKCDAIWQNFSFTQWHHTYKDTSEFVQHPWFGRSQALQNLLASSITLYN